jgi:hypothetical protein
MRYRCEKPEKHNYKYYGGRGIKVCDRWQHFEHFVADMGERPAGMTLDRIDTNGNYEPANCRWAAKATQANNTRANRLIEFKGETKTLSNWAREYGLTTATVWNRLSVLCWTVEQSLTIPTNG